MQLLSSFGSEHQHHRPLLVLSIVVFCLLATIAPSYGYFCPTGCTCYQRTVRCIRARLTTIPRMPQDTTVVDLRFNHFATIPKNAFAGLPYVTTIFLNENEIKSLQNGALDGLPALRFLYMNNNHLTSLPQNLFQQTPLLEGVYLENNEIEQLQPNTFGNLPKLHRISMFNNKLNKIPGHEFTQLMSLKRLRLDGNPIECDCGIYPLLQFYRRHPQRHQLSISLTCDTPNELSRRTFTTLNERDFHCQKPEILQAPHDMQLRRGDNVELPCRMVGDPEPEIIWMQNTNEILPQAFYETTHMQIMPSGSLKINSVDANDIGIYECIGRNIIGETKSQPIRMFVIDENNKNTNNNDNDNSNRNTNANYAAEIAAFENGNDIEAPPHFIYKPTDKNIALNGPDTVLDCIAVGAPLPEIQWFFNGRHIAQSTDSIRLNTNGSLIISEPITQTVAGTYRCEARNHLGIIQAIAQIVVRELPEIIMAPQNQTIKVGKPFILECDADGNPLPTILWQLNGTEIVANERISLENENTELVVTAAQEADMGIYTCIAENANGKTTAWATITVEQINSSPHLVIAPFDVEAFDGTTIEMPCKSEETEGVQITWRHDGRIIDPNVYLTEKYQISGAGSLFVKNVTIRDSGRYECSLRNDFGRTTASAVVTIRNAVDLAPGDRFVRIAFEEAAKEIDLAINNTVDALFTNRTNHADAQGPKNFANLLRVFRFPTGEARQLARAAEIYERTLVNIRKHVLQGDNLTIESDKYEFRDLLSREHLHLVAELSGCMEHREMPNCTDMCYHSKYRSIDGTCNNLQHPTWGASLTAFRRIAKPIYENGFGMPIGWSKEKLYAGFLKPSARLVSTSLISTKNITPDDTITHMVMQWGQFLDHDLDHAIPSVSSESWDGIDCKKTCEFAPPCYPIEVPPNDPRIKNRRCIDVVRSSSICGSGMTSVFFDSVQHREQINQLTSYIDASQVYGYSYQFSQELRNLTTDEGLLRVGVHFPHQKDMLPFAAPQDGMDCRRNLDENTMSCFVSGDIRVNEQIGLLAMHTIWMREHNRLAVRLRDVNPHWDGDTIYQEARKIVGAQMQHFTYKHWLPLIVGESGMRMLGEYGGYNPNVEATIANEFATAALRFGHTIINPLLHRLDSNFETIPQGHLQLHKAFFAPWRIAYEGGVDPLMRGMFAVPAKLKLPDQNLNTELTEKLFLTAHAVALDLAAINIQRGRDHGIPSYNVYRRFCNLSEAKTFEDLQHEITNRNVRQKLKELYGHPDNIDVWVGGVLEDQVEGGKVGPLFQCLLIEQLRRLRDGDRFYYENPSVFMPEQLAQIKQTSLARVLCDNGDSIDEITENIFILPKRQSGYKKCEDIAGINTYFWQDCGTCNSMPPLLSTYVPETYVKRRRIRRAINTEQQNFEESKQNILDDNNENFDSIFDINEERMSGLEEVVSSFQKELKKLHKKMRKFEETASFNGLKETEEISKPEQSTVSPNPKPKRSHCVDKNGTTRLNNEIWNPDVCSKCECRHAQVTCTHETCGEVNCLNGETPISATDECCPHCPKSG